MQNIEESEMKEYIELKEDVKDLQDLYYTELRDDLAFRLKKVDDTLTKFRETTGVNFDIGGSKRIWNREELSWGN